MAATIPASRRLAEDLAHVARFGADGDGVTRFAWSDELMQASRWLVRRLEELGLEAGIDAAGNVVGKWHAPGRALVLGSHLDTVPHGGRYDGTLGVLGALEAIRLLRERGFQPSRPVWLVAFNDEEGARFDTAMLGSRAFCGDDLAALASRRDRTGTTLAAAMQAQGFAVAELPSARAVDEVAGYLELHIEQGRVLEVRGAEIGAVRGICGVLGFQVQLDGQADHAGTTPIVMRRDALVGAARAIAALRDLATDRTGTLVTVGSIAAQPGGFNVIPGRCTFSVDVRATSDADLDQAERDVHAILERIAAEEGLDAALHRTHRLAPAAMDPAMVEHAAGAARDCGARVLEMVSGAGHDAMVLARHVPAAMVLVPSRDGISHSPLEHTSEDHCALGARVLARAVERLDAAHRPDLPAPVLTEESRA